MVPAAEFLEAGSALVQWSGRTVRGAHGAVQFEWLGVSARVSVSNATWVSVIATTAAPTMGTRLRAYTSDQGFGLYPLVSFWVSPHAAGNETLLFVIDNSSLGDRTITIENLMDQKYATTIHGFRTDGTFVPDLNPLPVNRNMEFIGDSITAATTVSLLLQISFGLQVRLLAQITTLCSQTGPRVMQLCFAIALARRVPLLQ
jgi:hypothetical protein